MLFNFSVLEQLIGFSQDAFLHLSPAVEQLIASTPAEIQKLNKSFQRKDHKELEYLLHKLRGSYATLGAVALPELSRSLETALHQRGKLPTDTEFALYLDCLEQSSAALELWLTQFTYHSDHNVTDIQQYIQYLENSDMQAYSLFQQQRAGWINYLGTDEFVLMEQDIMSLDFRAAAERLKRRMNQKDAGE